MVGDQSASDLHEFDKVDLIAVERLARVFPDQQAAAVRQPFPGPVPAQECIGAPPTAFVEKPAQFVTATQHAVLLVVEDSGHERALEDGVLVTYKVSSYYTPSLDDGIIWNDLQIAFPWPFGETKVIKSDKDARLPPLKDFESPFPYDGYPLAELRVSDLR